MGFREFNRPSEVHSNHAASNRIDLLRLISEGKRPALQEENEILVGENGKPLEKLQLASVSTPEHPILPGGMDGLKKLLRGNSSQRRLGDYRLRQLLGQGGFGDVYLGEHVDSKKKVAVKLLQHTHLTDQESVRKFREEAGNLLRLNHKHIVVVEGFGTTKDNVPYLVLEYAPNGTLRDAHSRGTHLSPEKVVEYVHQIADALQYLHDRKLMHLDLKPENVLLGAEGQLLLSDFGLVQDVHRTDSQSIPKRRAGTAPYMDPEYMLGLGPARPASDQYALAVMAYEWLSGNRPFQGNGDMIAVQHERMMPPPPLQGKIPGISREMEKNIEQVVFRALAKNPKDRFDSVKDFAKAFEQACRNCSPSTERGKQVLQEKRPVAKQAQKIDQGNKGKEKVGEKKVQKGEAGSPSVERERTNRHAEQQRLDHFDKRANTSRRIQAEDLAHMSPSEQIEWCVRGGIAKAFGAGGDRTLIPAIKNILRNRQIDLIVRYSIFKSLGLS